MPAQPVGIAWAPARVLPLDGGAGLAGGRSCAAHPESPQTPAAPEVRHELDEVQRVLQEPDLRTPTGYRNRVILEVLYSSGIRRQELVNLQVPDVDTEHGILIVREGKYSKDRAVPIGPTVCELLQAYLVGVRSEWIGADKNRYLFLNRFGDGMHSMAVWYIVDKYRKAAKLEKSVSPHTFRHSCATHMVRAGAPIRHVQELLGHTSIETTQIYTRVTINDLKQAHSRYHPREQGDSLP
jgi:integrase/recombinase XerD